MHFFRSVCTSHKKTPSLEAAGDKTVDSTDWLAKTWWLHQTVSNDIQM